jgi:DNA polymerase-3 subunit alpha
MKHTELHNHTHYSLLDGASTPAEYMKRAKEIGLTHLAITDHGTPAGHRDFQREAKKAGITPILGIEAYITSNRLDRRSNASRQDGTSVYNHITLLAKDAVGLENLNHINKIAWTEGFFHKPRCDFAILEQYREGIIALSGCLSGMIAKSLQNDMPIQADNYARQFKDLFEDDFYIEVMESNSPVLNQQLIEIGKRFDIKPVMTSDCHMASKADLPLAEAMLIINTNPKPRSQIDYTRMQKMEMMEIYEYLYPRRDKDGKEIRMSFADFELWLHTYDEHVANLEKQGIGPEAVDNTMLIANQIKPYPYYENLDTLPKFPDVDDEVVELRARLEKALVDKDLNTPENRARVFEEELPVIEAKNLSGYFLIQADFIDYANNNDILVGYGRGSAMSYLTNYLLGITRINPMPYDLLPERFLSLDREDPADIDTDFAIDGRYKVKAYAQRKYGNVSNIATIGYYKDKSAIKAAAKVFKAPFGETTKLGNKVDTIAEFEKHPDTQDYQKRYPHLVKLAKRLDGRIQNFGMHAGGIILSKEPIENHAPLQTAKDPADDSAPRVPVAALDMRELADMGFIKYDELGLRTLSIVDDAIRLIEKRHGIRIDIEQIPLDDKGVYEMISEGRTAGLFQAEQSASTKTILDMGGVSNLLELIASNALVRPGAANSTVGETYMNGKQTGNVSYIHEDMRKVTEETFGAVLYQEQQLLLCQRIAGMSQTDANKVRKAISKKIAEDLAIWKPEFIMGATEKIGKAKAEKVWKDLEASAEYAFAKCHALGYSMLTYLTAYLKYHYPIEFLVCSLNRMNTSNKTDKMKMLKYLIEAKRLGIRVKTPHVNHSGVDIEIHQDEQGDFIRMGLSQIKYISGKTAGPVLKNAPYDSYEHLLSHAINKRTMASLNAVGAAVFPDHPRNGTERENFFNYLSLPTLEVKDIPPRVYSQFRELRDYTEDETFVCMGIVGGERKKPGWRLIDIVDESAVASAFVNPNSDVEIGQVYIFMISNNSVVRYLTTEDFINDKGGAFQDFLEADSFDDVPDGMLRVVSFKSRTTKAGKKMADVVFSDAQKNLTSALVFPTMFMRGIAHLSEGAVVDVKLEKTDDGTTFVENIL